MNDSPLKPSGTQTTPLRSAAGDRTAHQTRMLGSQELFAGGHELHIEHNGAVYTLRLTSKGKLILTK